MNHLKGVHHVTAITSNAEKIYDFFTNVLGMRLVKKTVNQDDIQTYHLFFADDKGSAGTDMTFFDFAGIRKGQHGTNEISKTSFRVPDDKALEYWVKRFDRLGVKHTGIKEMFGKKTLSPRHGSCLTNHFLVPSHVSCANYGTGIIAAFLQTLKQIAS